MHIILFEDSLVSQIYPITVGKAAFLLNVGSYRLIDLVKRLGGTIEAVVRPHLREIVAIDFPEFWTPENGQRQGPILLLNARAVPHAQLLDVLKKLIDQEQSGVVHKGHQIACVYLAGQNNTILPNQVVGAGQLMGLVSDMQLDSVEANIPLIEYTHDLVRFQKEKLNENLEDRLRIGNFREIEDGVFVSGEATIGNYHVFDTKKGPILLENGVNIGPYCFIRGPVYVGENTKVLEYAAIKDYVTVMETAKIGGEVEASTIGAYSNKQHHGFLGHSYLGNWINLGAGTCNSDLKNTYGEVTTEFSGRKIKSGMQFLGCVIGDYSKTAINTSIFTGKIIGACSMVYGFVTTNVPSFVNYARSFGQVTEATLDVVISSQERMFKRRNVEQRECDRQLLRDIYDLTRNERQLANEPLSL
ncbi:MAG: hypothetical protein FWC43_00425 [Planctomycetaceae bacterium]|nr:hypothetical protein [Planctomycetaceae bacterium]